MDKPDSDDKSGSSPPRRLVKVKEACAYGRIGETELYEYLHDGTIKAYKRRSTTLVDLDSIDAFYASLPPFSTRGATTKPKTKVPKAIKKGKGVKV